ncbi:jg19508 [Pararge aegeria aegeria]|uniref:Jg19508 protein n=1 Tax=Pararge aegeria aegeria TaxID=348720 RepID=A0A8S4QZ55_9NEOP|nr:jg19508 [Pararge aegeria aegeria]
MKWVSNGIDDDDDDDDDDDKEKLRDCPVQSALCIVQAVVVHLRSSRSERKKYGPYGIEIMDQSDSSIELMNL